ncbi:MAG: hypothetical protein HZB53_06535 [Chloroflexi bacterium]|nr:hypothetical protein [Chloroflexota bacterium]
MYLPALRLRRPAQPALQRQLHDLGELVSGRTHELVVTYSQHVCAGCGRTFSMDLSDLAPANARYTHTA